MKIAVIGAGICGISAARTLCERGHQVTLHERFELFHDRGSSHGASRIVRRAYPDAFYTAIMAEAYPLWHDLEQASSTTLLHECGLLYYGVRDSENLQSVADSLTSLQVPFEILDKKSVKDKLPELRLTEREIAIWTPEAGWVDAEKALTTSYELARRAGLLVEFGELRDLDSVARQYDAVLIAAGAWTSQFVSIPARVTLQTFAYIESQISGPVWIEDSYDNPYGFPADKLGQKIGIHRPGKPIDPNETDRQPSLQLLDLIKQTANVRFGIADPVLRAPKTCLYTSTANEDFLVGRLRPNTFFASACSGHGFKMGPWVGRLLANFAEDVDRPENHPRFFLQA